MKKTEITTSELVDFLHDGDTIILDVRPIAAYNGWHCMGNRAAAILRAQEVFR